MYMVFQEMFLNLWYILIPKVTPKIQTSYYISGKKSEKIFGIDMVQFQ